MGKPSTSAVQRTLVVLVVYLAIGLVAYRYAFSVSGWLIVGLAPILWLDRFVFCLLPWPESISTGRAVLVRLGLVVIAAAAVFLIAGRFIAWSEILHVGLAASSFLFLAELCMEGLFALAARLGRPPATPPRFRIRNLVIMGALFVLVLILSPLGHFHPLSVTITYSPTQAGIPHEDIHLHTADGLALAGWFVPAAQPRGSVIFCHGHGGSRQQVFMVLAQLHALDLNVLAFDFRGHGDSPGHTVCFGLREVPDVQAAEAYLVQRCPGQPIYLFGVSYGAAVTLQALPHLTHVQAAWVQSGFSRLSDVAHNRFANLGDDRREWLIATYSALVWLDTGRSPLRANPIDHLSGTRVPIMFCHGKQDALIPFTQAEELFTTYTGPKSCYWLDQAGHDDLIQTAGPDYAERLKAFFTEQRTPSTQAGPQGAGVPKTGRQGTGLESK